MEQYFLHLYNGVAKPFMHTVIMCLRQEASHNYMGNS